MNATTQGFNSQLTDDGLDEPSIFPTHKSVCLYAYSGSTSIADGELINSLFGYSKPVTVQTMPNTTINISTGSLLYNVATNTTFVSNPSRPQKSDDALAEPLIQNYQSGIIDIPELARKLRKTEDEIALILEQSHRYRPVSRQKVTKKEKDTVLTKLCQIRAERRSHEYNSRSWLIREVIASQRMVIYIAAMQGATSPNLLNGLYTRTAVIALTGLLAGEMLSDWRLR